ncbi:MAG: tyrosine-type recombinase/integrase, partial [Clostridia bacterium]|nr:tyrosine-type recombinase/integrase [Clostridia bacterium]
MNNTLITVSNTKTFERYLTEQEKSQATICKYLHDLRTFAKYAQGRPVNKLLLLSYKERLEQEYSLSSANSMLAALNSFLRFCKRPELCIKPFRVQKEIFRHSEQELTKNEYQRLVAAAERQRNQRLSLLLQTICGTGIRVSELPYITAEAVLAGTARVTCKGKSRTVFIVTALQKKLKQYMKKLGIQTGAIFVTKTGKPLDRSNIWKEMK